LRLGRFLSNCDVASRRNSEEIIMSGRVRVNGKIILDPAFGVDETVDVVDFDNKRLDWNAKNKKIYIMYHKPVGVISTMSKGQEKGLCVADVINIPERIYPVGRLDQDSSGLLILTNDGDLTHRLTHPSHKVQKEYEVRTIPKFMPNEYIRMARGVYIDGRKVGVDLIAETHGGRTLITIHEGRKRIIRRMFRELKYRVAELKRLRIGELKLGSLGIGKWRKLTALEVKKLQEIG